MGSPTDGTTPIDETGKNTDTTGICKTDTDHVPKNDTTDALPAPKNDTTDALPGGMT